MTTTLYRAYDERDRLLYVGITDRGFGRLREHERSQDWWVLVERIHTIHFESRVDAEAQERMLIERFHPPFNTMHNAEPGALGEFSELLGVSVVPAFDETAGAVKRRCCANCQRANTRLRGGRCPACYIYQRRNGRERPPEVIEAPLNTKPGRQAWGIPT